MRFRWFIARSGAACIASAALSLAVSAAPGAARAQLLSAPLSYTFNAAGTLFETGAPQNSTSPYWWLAEGGRLVISGGVGNADAHSPYVLLSKDGAEDASVQAYFDRERDDYLSAADRHAYDGEELVARYADGNNYYYAGIREDGDAVIKKKQGGVYTTLASAKLLPGVYDPNAANGLIPLNRWIGLKLAVSGGANGIPELSLYTDADDTGAWSLALTAADAGAGLASGLWGVESDYADAALDNFLLSPESPAESAPPSYDATVLADDPALYLTMSSSASGTEHDASGHGLSGTYKGGAPESVSMPNGDAAARFNGAGEYLTVPSAPSLSVSTAHALTWEGWVRPDTFDFPHATADGYVDWLGKCENYSPDCEWEARLYGSATPEDRPDRFSAYVFNPSAGLGSGADWQPAAPLPSGAWLYVVAEYETQTAPSACPAGAPGTIHIWVNGVEQDFDAHAPTGCMSQFNVTPRAGDSPLNVGTMALDSWFPGAIGKVAVYDYLLSQAQISAHYEAMTGSEPSGSCGDTCAAALPQ